MELRFWQSINKSPNIQNTIHIKEDKKYSQSREGRMKSEANLADKSQLQKKLASIGTNLEIKTGYDDMVYSKTPSSNLPKISNGLAKGGFLKEKINSMYKKSIRNSNLLNAAASAHKDALVKKMKKVHLSRDFRDRNRLLDPQVSPNPSPYKHKASDVLEKSVLKSSLRPIERPIETYLPEASKGEILRRSENSPNKLAASLSNHVTPSKAAPSYSPKNPSSNPLHSRNKSFTNTGSRNNSMHHLGHNLHANPQPLLSHLHSSFQKTPLTRRHPLLFKKQRKINLKTQLHNIQNIRIERNASVQPVPAQTKPFQAQIVNNYYKSRSKFLKDMNHTINHPEPSHSPINPYLTSLNPPPKPQIDTNKLRLNLRNMLIQKDVLKHNLSHEPKEENLRLDEG